MNGAGYDEAVGECEYELSFGRFALLLQEKSVKWPFRFTFDFSQLPTHHSLFLW